MSWWRKWVRVLLAVAGGFTVEVLGQPNMPRDYVVEVSASIQRSPPGIRLTWPADARALSYEVFRKQLHEAAWQRLRGLAGSATEYMDSAVAVGSAYEYRLVKQTTRGLTGYGYIYAGIDLPLVENRGKLVLVVDGAVAGALEQELTRLQVDLVGDGWTVIRREVSRTDSPAHVRSVIKAEYDADRENVKGVFLFGRVPVAYSGNIAPDGHEQHRGAWPADVYYAEMDGPWTDESVNTTQSEKKANWNIPGDGKFDQNEPPSAVDLQLGRVDLSNLTAFSNKAISRSEIDLLRQYLDKNHRFRHGLIDVPRRGLICDNFEDKGDDPVANSGWRNFAAFFGAEHVTEVDWGEYLPATTAGGYLWSYGSGGGSTYYMSAGVATSDDFATQDVRVVFSLFLGSFYGDWDNESNFLRAALGSGDILTAAYAGFPHWHLQHMAVGLPIGFSTRLTQNITRGGVYSPHNQGTHEVHIALMGDPTLRMHPVHPPSNLTAASGENRVTLTWNPSPAPGVIGYHVYRSSSATGPFQRVTGSAPIQETGFIDSAPPGTYTYMVRAIRLETSASGTYFNPSQGIFANGSSRGDVPPPPPPDTPSITGAEFADGNFKLRLSGRTGQSFQVEATADFRIWDVIATGTFRGSTFQVEDANASNFEARFYRLTSP